MKYIVAQLGARRRYLVPRALHAAGMLDRFVTDACGDILPWRLLKGMPGCMFHGALARLAGRGTGLPRERVSGLFRFTVSTIAGSYQQKHGETNIAYWVRRNRCFCELVAGRKLEGADAVYVFNGAGLEILREAKRRGMFAVVDQTSAPMRWDAGLLREEAARWPEWTTAVDALDGWEGMAAREEEEWRLADRIVCGSEYVVESMRAVDGPVAKCKVVQPVFDAAASGSQPRNKRDGALNVLFAGTLNLRKGLPYLYQAIRRLDPGQFRFRIVGPSEISAASLAKLGAVADLRGIVPGSEMSSHYAWADVLALPTLSEGSANVCNEALAYGVPVITTPNAGSAVRDGIDGFIIPIRDVESLVARLMEIAGSGKLLEDLSRNACTSGRSDMASYVKNLREALV